MTVGLLTALVAVLALGSVGAVAVARHQQATAGVAAPRSTAHPAPTSRSVSTTGDSVGEGTPPVSQAPPVVSSTRSTPQPAATAVTAQVSTPVESDPTTAPSGPSNNLTVQMSPATRTHARSQDVQQLLQSYFDAINQHDYASWEQSVTKALSSHQTNQQWLLAYATTVDSSIWMQSMRDDPLQVQIRFTSQQDPDLAPSDLKVGCLHWTLTYQIADQDGQLAVGSTVQGSVNYVKC